MIEFSVRRPVAVFMICIGLIVLGYIAAKRIPVQLMPNIQTPEFTIVTTFKGASPEEVENLVTSPLERSLSTVSGLLKTSSDSTKERSEIRLNFKANINYAETLSVLRDRIESAGLPEGTSRPKILRFQANAAPIIQLAIKAKKAGVSPFVTAELLKENLLKKLEAVDGVALATLLGSPSKAIEVLADPAAMQSYGLTLPVLPEAIQSQNRSYPGGEINENGKSTSVRLGLGVKSLEQLKEIVVKKEGTKLVRLGDFTKIQEITEPPRIRTHLQGEDSFIVEVRKESEANSVKVAESAREIVEEFLKEQSENVQGWILFDQGVAISQAVDNVGESVFHGGILAGLVIFLLLQSWWPTFVVCISMPISILITFILMYFTGISFNLMSLAGLALGVGMLVDNSTVVLDNIHLFQIRMSDPRSSSLWGTKTVVGAITGSTLATIAVFGPLAFVEGMIGQMFRDVAATVCYSLAASLFSAVFIIPMLSSLHTEKASKDNLKKASHWGELQKFWYQSGLLNSILEFFKKILLVYQVVCKICVKKLFELLFSQEKGLLRPVFKFLTKIQDSILLKISIWVQKIERYLMENIPLIIKDSRKTVQWSLGLTILGLLVLYLQGAELFPDEASNRLNYSLEFLPGQNIEATDKKIRNLEKILVKLKGVESVSSMVGENGSHTARLIVLVNYRESLEIARTVSQTLSKEPGMFFDRMKDSLMSTGKPVQIEIYDEDLNQLKSSTLQVKKTLEKIPHLVDIDSNIKTDLSEIIIQFSKEKLSWFGADSSAFVGSLRPMLMGLVSGPIQIKGEELPIVLRIPSDYFDSMEKVKYWSVPQDEERRLYLSQVSEVREEKVQAAIKRLNRKRMAVISANFAGADLESINKKIRETLTSQKEFKNINWKLGGEDEERSRATKSLLMAVVLSIFLIYLLLAGQFENLIQPVIVLCAVPFCISGIALFLILFNMNVSAMVFVGFIILVGVSVNTSIVMVDFANQKVAEGRSLEDSISEAAVRRMRPILVTTLSGVLGLLPMALSSGPGSAMQKPLAVTMIGGHLSSTILTMLIVPVIYVAFAKGSKNASKPG